MENSEQRHFKTRQSTIHNFLPCIELSFQMFKSIKGVIEVNRVFTNFVSTQTRLLQNEKLLCSFYHDPLRYSLVRIWRSCSQVGLELVQRARLQNLEIA